MNWINFFGIILMVIIMIPNSIYGATHKEGFKNSESVSKTLELFEQIGRFGSFAFMVLNIPYLCFGFWTLNGFLIYIIVNAVLCFLYCVGWIVFWNKHCLAKAITLSVLPSIIFIFSGIIQLNIALIVFSIMFSICHITISCKNKNII